MAEPTPFEEIIEAAEDSEATIPRDGGISDNECRAWGVFVTTVRVQLDRAKQEGAREERERIKASRKHLGAWEAAGKPQPVYVIPDWVFDAD